jgi:hypothetical protein
MGVHLSTGTCVLVIDVHGMVESALRASGILKNGHFGIFFYHVRNWRHRGGLSPLMGRFSGGFHLGVKKPFLVKNSVQVMRWIGFYSRGRWQSATDHLLCKVVYKVTGDGLFSVPRSKLR